MLKVLSIDGGGMKGIVSVMVLQRLEYYIKLYSKNEKAVLSDYFDLIGGTSTGAIITALLLTTNKETKTSYETGEILELYLQRGKEIFHRPLAYRLRTMFGLFGPKYTNKDFEKLLNQYLENTVLEDLRKDGVFTAYDTANREAIFYSTLSKKSWERQVLPVKEVVLSSTAAPTYFPPVHITSSKNKDNCHIDGGIVVNNPALSTLIEGFKHPKYKGLNDIILVSVGNVTNTDFYSYKRVKRWGIFGWALPIVSIVFDSDTSTVDYETKKLFEAFGCRQNYLRLELRTDGKVPPMDDISKEAIETLLLYGNQLIKRNDTAIKRFAKRLVEE